MKAYIYYLVSKNTINASRKEILREECKVIGHPMRFNMNGKMISEQYVLEAPDNKTYKIDVNEIDTVLEQTRYKENPHTYRVSSYKEPYIISLDPGDSESGAKYIAHLFNAYLNEKEQNNEEMER